MTRGGGNKSHGMSHTRPWVIWTDMKRRCKNPKRRSYASYGKKGVTYDERWEKFENFWEDMRDGYSDDLTLERINPQGNYNKNNCCWIELGMQGRNKNKYVTNTTGLAGTCIANSGGITVLKATISDKGERYTKSYSLNKYTLDEALLLAKGWRDMMKKKLNYSKFHGESFED